MVIPFFWKKDFTDFTDVIVAIKIRAIRVIRGEIHSFPFFWKKDFMDYADAFFKWTFWFKFSIFTNNPFCKNFLKMKKIFLLLLFFNTTWFYVSAQYTNLFDFAGLSNGYLPTGSLISDGTFLYGMTSNGGWAMDGTLFKILPNGTGYSQLFDFLDTASGSYPQGSLISDGTFLYGTTMKGGANDYGTVFKIKLDGTGYSRLLDFSDSANGAYPMGSLISDGTFLYGTTSEGGVNNLGVLFKIKPDGTSFSKLLDFSGVSNGQNPNGSLISDGTFLYGMTLKGGVDTSGVIFKIMPDGTGYSKLLDFSGAANGINPYGSLISDGIFLYGMTSRGGVNNLGTIFKIMPNGTSYSKLLDFSGTINGSYPHGDLIFDGTFFYGMTYWGGANSGGAIFKILPNGTGYHQIFNFYAASGFLPTGSLFSDGIFLYGMASGGGAQNFGTVFKCGIATSINENDLNDFFSLYPNPSNGIFTLKWDMGQAASDKGKNYEIEIYNCLGEIVYQSKIQSRDIGTKSEINLSDEPNGIYLVTIKTKENSFTQKISIEK
jgi:uncharacterized repeat protein (TIGR03803 family)